MRIIYGAETFFIILAMDIFSVCRELYMEKYDEQSWKESNEESRYVFLTKGNTISEKKLSEK